METFINITGNGLSSKSAILRKIDVFDNQVIKLPFNNFKVCFDNKKEAIKALSKAYQLMKSDFTYSDYIRYSYGKFLEYDAGIARIENK